MIASRSTKEIKNIHLHQNMNKTYIANENHPELKVGVEIRDTLFGWMTEGNMQLSYGDSPENKPEWYDEVVVEPTSSEWVNGVIGACKKLRENEDPTVSANEISEILSQIARYGDVDAVKLATHLAKLNKRV